jgi:hypothetical protein
MQGKQLPIKCNESSKQEQLAKKNKTFGGEID